MAIDKSKYAKGLDYVETQKKAQEAKEKAQQAGKPAAQSVPFTVGVTRAQFEGIESESAPVPSVAVTRPKAGGIGSSIEDAMKSTFDSLRGKVAAPPAEQMPQVRPAGVQPAGMLYGDGGKNPLSSAQKMRGAVVDKLNNLTAKDMLNAAQKEYDDYLQSDEYKQKKQAQQAAQGAYLQQQSGVSTMPYAAAQQQQETDLKEKELRAKRDYYQRQVNMEKDKAVMDADLAELETWSDEDRAALETYVAFRVNSISSGGYAVPAQRAYNSLVAKYGAEKVANIAESWQRRQNAETAQRLQEESAAAVKGKTGAAILHSAGTVPANLIGSVASPFGVAGDIATRTGRYSTLDPYNNGNMANVYSGAVRGQVAQDIAGDVYDENGNKISDGGALRQGLSYAYQGGMSAIDSVARATVGGGGAGALTLAAMGSFGQTMSEASKQGATPTQALILATGTAALEAATEKIPLERMLTAAKGGAKGARAIAAEALKQAGIEATTEEVSLLGSLLLEGLVLQEKSNYRQGIGDAIASGMSYKEAQAQADKAVMQEALQTLAVSGFAGLFSGAGSAAVGQTGGGNEQTPASVYTGADGGAEPTEEAARPKPAPQVQAPAAQPVAAQEAVKTPEEVVLDAAAETGRQFAPQPVQKSAEQQSLDELTATVFPNTQEAEQGIVNPTQQEATAQTQPQEAAQPQIPQEQKTEAGIKGTGAAEANFTGTAAYDELLSDDNVQPFRKGDERQVEVPKTDAQGRNVSAFVANSMNAKVTPDAFTDTIKKMAMEDKGSYEVVSDETSLKMAAEEVQKDGGVVESVKKVQEAAKSGKVGNLDVAKAQLLYQHLVNMDNQVAQELAADVWTSMREMATVSGRNLHLFSLLRKMTPEGRMLAVEKDIERYVNNLNSGRTENQKVKRNQRGTKEINETKAAVRKARKDVAENTSRASKTVKFRNGKLGADQKGEPFVFEYAQKVGEAIAQSVERKIQPPKQKTFLQTIAGELSRFAAEKLPPTEKVKPMSATDILRDYVQNQEFYAKAWEKAQEEIRRRHPNDQRLQEFINSGIGVDANANQQNKIMMRALATVAMETGETADMIRRQEALGVSNIAETISQRLIYDTGATGEMAQTIRDAAKEFVKVRVSEAAAKPNARNYDAEYFVNEAMRDIKITMAEVAKQNAADKAAAKYAVIRRLSEKYGLSASDALRIADAVGDTFDSKAQEQARKILEQRFGEKPKATRKGTDEVLEEYANLGAFDSEYAEKSAESFIKSALDDIGVTVSQMAKNNATKENTINAIADMLQNQHGIDAEDASHIAQVVDTQLTAMVEAQAKKILEQKFKPKAETQRKTVEQLLTEYASLGAFDPLSDYNEKATAKIVGEEYNAKINSELAQNFLNAKTEADQEAALDAIYKDIASQTGATLEEMWDNWRHLSMLGNPLTQVRNFGGTASFMPYVGVKRNVAAFLEKRFVDEQNRTKAVLGLGKNDRALIDWARSDAETAAQEALKHSTQMQDKARNKIDEYRVILPGFLDKASKGVTNFMEATDMVFKKSEYSKALASFLKSRGYTIEQVQNGQVPENVMSEGRQIAVEEAKKATFNDRSEFAKTLSKLRVKGNTPWGKAANVVTQGILPYLNTPANIVSRLSEYSPAGIAKSFFTMAAGYKGGDVNAITQGIDQLAAGLTGTGAYVLGAALAHGLIPGVRLIGRIDEEDDYPEGAIENSLQIGDKFYSIGWIAPAAVPLLIGANIYNDFAKKENRGEINDAWDVLNASANGLADIIDPILELSVLSGLNDVVEAYAAEETPGQGVLAVLTTAALNYFTQGLPTIFGQIEKATEETKTSTYVNTDNRMEARAKKVLSNASQKLPGDLYRIEKMDRWGEPVKQQGDNAAERALNAFLNPFTVSTASNDPVDLELQRLSKAQTMNVEPPEVPKKLNYKDTGGNDHEGYRLTAEEYTTYARVQGQTSKRVLDNLEKSAAYQKLTDTQKAYAINAAYDYAQEMAKREALPDYYSTAPSWISGTQESDTAAFIARGAYQQLDSVVSQTVENLGQGWAVSDAAKQDLDRLWNSYKGVNKAVQGQIMEQAEGDTKLYLEARKGGVDASEWMQAMGKLEKVQPIKGSTGVKQWQNYSAIANAGLDNAATDAMMRAYMDESTERKYNYVRNQLGYSAKDYAALYAGYTSGKKAEEVRSQWVKNYGISEQEAKDLYKLFNGTWKPWED